AGFLMVRYLAHAQAGLLMAILLATSPLNIYFAQEGRSYALLLFFLSMSFYTLLCLQQEPGRFYGVGYALFLCAAFYTHYLAFLGFLSQVLYVALQKDPMFRRRWLQAVGLAGLLYLPWLPKLFAQRTPIGTFAANSWMLDEHSRWLWILRAGVLPMETIFSGGFYQITSSAGLHPWFFVQGAALLACLYRVKQTHPRAFAILALWLVVPIVVFLMLDITLGANFLKFTRFTVMINPATYILLALTLGSLRASYRVIALILIVAVNFMIAARYYKEPYKISDYKNAALYLETKLQTGDLVVIYNPSGETWRTSALLLCLGHYFPFKDHPFLLAEADPLGHNTVAEVNQFNQVAMVRVGQGPLPSWILDQFSIKAEAHFDNLGRLAILIRHTPTHPSPPIPTGVSSPTVREGW